MSTTDTGTTSATTTASTSSTTSPTTSATSPTTSATSPTTSATTTNTNTSRTSTSAPTTAPVNTSRTTALTPIQSSTTTPLGPIIFTSTQTVSNTSGLPSETNKTDGQSSSKGFFDNTGAVAGVFSVVGLIGVAILVVLITNSLRRRRAKQFDRELQRATAEAAAASPPRFLDDDDDDRYNRGGGGGTVGYNGASAEGGYSGRSGALSDVSSHGTYGQPPMETYGMREMGVGVGEVYDPYGTGGSAAMAGAAGIGVARARSMRTDDRSGYAAAFNEGSNPYPALAAPHPYGTQAPVDMYAPPGAGRASPNDILEAAGLGSHVAGAGALAQQSSNGSLGRKASGYDPRGGYGYGSGSVHQRGPSAGYGQQGYYQGDGYANGGYQNGSPTSGPGQPYAYPAPPPQQQQQYQPPQQGYVPRHSVVTEDAMEDVYGGYVVDDQEPLAPGAAQASSHGHSLSGGKGSSGGQGYPPVPAHGQPQTPPDAFPNPFGQAEDDSEPKRVLKVANE